MVSVCIERSELAAEEPRSHEINSKGRMSDSILHLRPSSCLEQGSFASTRLQWEAAMASLSNITFSREDHVYEIGSPAS